MPSMLYPLSRKLLFRLDPETAHGLSVRAMAHVGANPPLRAVLASTFAAAKAESVEAFGLRFPNRVGLAAGYDKDGEAWRGLAALGFGHIEVGDRDARGAAGKSQTEGLPSGGAAIGH